MKEVKFTPRCGWPRYDVIDDDDASELAATYTREAYDRGDVDEYITIIPDMFEGRPDLLEWAKKEDLKRKGGDSW